MASSSVYDDAAHDMQEFGMFCLGDPISETQQISKGFVETPPLGSLPRTRVGVFEASFRGAPLLYAK